MSKENVRAIVDANIHENGMQLISGPVMNATLKAIIDDYADKDRLDEIYAKMERFNAADWTSVQEEGFFVVDKDNHIGFMVTPDGVGFIASQALKRDINHTKRWYEKRPYPTSLNIQQIATVTGVSSNYRQGGINVGRYFFQFHNTNDKIGVYDMEDGWSLVANITTGCSNSQYHDNNVTLGKRLNSTDRFPLFYVASQNTAEVLVLHISDSWECSLVQTIKFDSVASLNPWIDEKAGYIYWGENTTLWRTPIPELSESSVHISAEEIEEVGFIPGLRFVYGYQQLEPDYGFHTLVFSYPPNTYLQTYDALSGQLLWDIKLSTSEELESLGFYKGDFYAISLNGKVFKISK